MWFALIRKDFIDKITIAVCVGLISTAFSGVFLPDKISESENRTLAQMPKIVMNKTELRKFPRLFEAFVNDNFGGRGLLLQINHTILTLFKRPTSKNVIYGKDGWLFFAADNSLQDMAGNSYLTSEEKQAGKVRYYQNMNGSKSKIFNIDSWLPLTNIRSILRC